MPKEDISLLSGQKSRDGGNKKAATFKIKRKAAGQGNSTGVADGKQLGGNGQLGYSYADQRHISNSYLEEKIATRNERMKEMMDKRFNDMKRKIELKKAKPSSKVENQQLWSSQMVVKGHSKIRDMELFQEQHKRTFDGKSCDQYYKDRYMEEVLHIKPEEGSLPRSPVLHKRSMSKGFDNRGIENMKMVKSLVFEEPVIVKYHKNSQLSSEAQVLDHGKYRYYNPANQKAKFIAPSLPSMKSSKVKASGVQQSTQAGVHKWDPIQGSKLPIIMKKKNDK